jgi:N-acetylmuramoyl-L-alanine amidase
MGGGGWHGRVRRLTLGLVVCLTLANSASARPKTRSKAAPPNSPATGRVTDVRFFSLTDATRIAVEVSGDFEYRSDRLPNPDRIFFDIAGVKPTRVPKGTETIPVGDALVKQIRIAETQPGTTRLVLDLATQVETTASQLSNPSRLIIEVRPVDKKPQEPATAETGNPARRFEPPKPTRPAPVLTAAKLTAPKLDLPALSPNPALERAASATVPRPLPPPSDRAPPPDRAPLADRAKDTISPAMPLDTPATKSPSAAKSAEPASALAAKRNSSGDRSLTRALGLKLGRVVLDAGHGGHDGGTRGPSGLLEKDLVLDVSKRLGALIEERLGSEVIFTRDDDTFIPLEERTRIANRHKADLFLSIHANSSSVHSASGIETYYLNFTTSKSALDLAARENAASEQSIYDLKDLVQKIALNDKLGESREFAERVQTSLSVLSARNNVRSKDRGVRKAPFVVLIGASMPSILAEIGFVSNPHDEGLMKKPEYRQKIAEALYKGVAQYASGLSHFQVARQKTAE